MEISITHQILSFAGALLVLIAYAGHQLKWIDPRGTLYNLLNIIGSGILAYIAFHPFQIGFVVLEVAWVLISVHALTRSQTQRQDRLL